MGNLRRITLLLLVIVFATNIFNSITVEAAISKPTKTWDLTEEGQYKFSGKAADKYFISFKAPSNFSGYIRKQ